MLLNFSRIPCYVDAAEFHCCRSERESATKDATSKSAVLVRPLRLFCSRITICHPSLSRCVMRRSRTSQFTARSPPNRARRDWDERRLPCSDRRTPRCSTRCQRGEARRAPTRRAPEFRRLPASEIPTKPPRELAASLTVSPRSLPCPPAATPPRFRAIPDQVATELILVSCTR